jgi:hypothetical protein
VVGSVLTVIFSILFGFDVVVWIGAGVYAIAILAAAGLGDASRPEPIREETVSSDPLPGEPGSGEEPVLQPV